MPLRKWIICSYCKFFQLEFLPRTPTIQLANLTSLIKVLTSLQHPIKYSSCCFSKHICKWKNIFTKLFKFFCHTFRWHKYFSLFSTDVLILCFFKFNQAVSGAVVLLVDTYKLFLKKLARWPLLTLNLKPTARYLYLPAALFFLNLHVLQARGFVVSFEVRFKARSFNTAQYTVVPTTMPWTEIGSVLRIKLVNYLQYVHCVSLRHKNTSYVKLDMHLHLINICWLKVAFLNSFCIGT